MVNLIPLLLVDLGHDLFNLGLNFCAFGDSHKNLLSKQFSVGVEMGLPVTCVEVGVADGVAAMEHPAVAHIDAHMGDPRRVM